MWSRGGQCQMSSSLLRNTQGRAYGLYRVRVCQYWCAHGSYDSPARFGVISLRQVQRRRRKEESAVRMPRPLLTAFASCRIQMIRNPENAIASS